MAGLIIALSITSVNAAVIVEYGTAGSTTSLAATTVDAGVVADNLEAGPGLNVQNFSTFNFTGWDTGSTDFAAAVAANDFWTWGFDVNSVGMTLGLTTMDFRVDRSGSGPDDFEVQVSVNGGGGITVQTHDYSDSSSGVNFLAVDLSAVPTLNNGDSVVFTLAAFNSEGNTGSFDLELVSSQSYGIQVNGDFVAIPEPSSAILGSLALLGLVRRKR